MNISTHGQSDTGRCRPNNEDAFLVEDDFRLYAVADGLGGLEAGEEASAAAVASLRREANEARREKRPLDLVFAVSQAHLAVRRINRRFTSAQGSGTTLTALLLQDESVLVTHAGDSALYLFKPGGWEKITTDHTEAEELRRRRPGMRIPERFEHTLTRCLGQPVALEIDHHHRRVEPGDRLLLCTDGLTRHLTPEELFQMARAAAGPQEFLDQAIRLGNERGGSDNLTGVAVFVD